VLKLDRYLLPTEKFLKLYCLLAGKEQAEHDNLTGWRMKGLNASLRRRTLGYWWMKSWT